MSRDDVPDWEAKYWANREQQLASQKKSLGQPTNQATRGYPEIDPMKMMQQRMMQGHLPGQTPSSNRSVMLREGAEYFRHLKGGDGFGNVIPLVRSMGQLNGVAGREFAHMGETRGILVDGMNMVDMSKINEEPDRISTYVRVRAPFVGDILVKSGTIIETQGSQRVVLKG